MKLDCPHGRLEKHKGPRSTGYSNAIVRPDNALIGGDNCGVGGRRGPLFSNQPATEIKAEEEEARRPRFLAERGAQRWGVRWPF